jgi:hypothetical protein
MTESDDQILTKEWLAEKLQRDQEQREKEEQENAAERAVEEMRAAWIEENGVEPTESEIKQALALKRQGDAAERAKANRQIASRQIRRAF